MMRGGSNGIKWIRKNVIVAVQSRTGISCTKRRCKNVSRFIQAWHMATRANKWRESAFSDSREPKSLAGRPNLPHPVVGGRLDLEVMYPVVDCGAAGREIEKEDLGVVETHLLDLVVHLLPFGGIEFGLSGERQLGDLGILVSGPDGSSAAVEIDRVVDDRIGIGDVRRVVLSEH